MDAFEQKGTALTNSKALVPEDAKRRDDTLIDPWQKRDTTPHCKVSFDVAVLVDVGSVAKSPCNILKVKHLPASATAAELRERFARFGALIRCTLAPSNTAGRVVWESTATARRAIQPETTDINGLQTNRLPD